MIFRDQLVPKLGLARDGARGLVSKVGTLCDCGSLFLVQTQEAYSPEFRKCPNGAVVPGSPAAYGRYRARPTVLGYLLAEGQVNASKAVSEGPEGTPILVVP
jgi:hypothetical protein